MLSVARRRLVVLDDDPAMTALIAFVAARHFEVEVASGPDHFVALACDPGTTFALLDLMMPQTDGIEVLRMLAAAACRAQLVLMSALDERVLDSARRSAAERGLPVHGILAKPFTPMQLLALLDRPLARADDAAAPVAEEVVAVTAADLEAALDAGAIEVAYQPKIAVANGSLVGFEALARWTHPLLGAVPPAVFVPLAERCGLIGRLTEAVLEQALGWFGAAGLPDGTALSINLSALSLDDTRLADTLQARCAVHGVDPAHVVLELTETGPLRDLATALDTLTRLRMKGFRLAIDDFGCGYSSMQQLARLPFTWLKIDRAFVRDMATRPDALRMVEATLSLGAGLGLTCVAEGVETPEALQILQRLGCDYAQGYHIARPMQGGTVASWLAQCSESSALSCA